jgi:hypothetical protein
VEEIKLCVSGLFLEYAEMDENVLEDTVTGERHGSTVMTYNLTPTIMVENLSC